MTIDEKIKELEEKLEEIKKENEKLKTGRYTKDKRWRALFNEKYYYLNDCGGIEIFLESSTLADKYRYEIGNYFKTREEAEKHSQNRLTYQQLKDIALRLNKGQEFDWKNVEQGKYYIFYDSVVKKFESGVCGTYRNLTEIYCLDENFLNVALEEIGEEKLKQLLEWGI